MSTLFNSLMSVKDDMRSKGSRIVVRCDGQIITDETQPAREGLDFGWDKYIVLQDAANFMVAGFWQWLFDSRHSNDYSRVSFEVTTGGETAIADMTWTNTVHYKFTMREAEQWLNRNIAAEDLIATLESEVSSESKRRELMAAIMAVSAFRYEREKAYA